MEEDCYDCRGTGEGYAGHRCSVCGGKGWIYIEDPDREPEEPDYDEEYEAMKAEERWLNDRGL